MALLLAVLLGGCSVPLGRGPASPHASTTQASATPAAPTVTAESPAATSSGWRDVGSGVSLRTETATPPGSGSAGQITVSRVEKSAGRLRVGYAPTAPAPIDAWAIAHPTAVVMINGGYFDENNRTTALLVSDGVRSGASYSGFGGMLSMSTNGAVSLRSLRDHPYSSAEKPRQAVQSFPMLVIDGAATSLPNENGAESRRSIVAVDASSRLLLITIEGGWTLTQTGQWLAGSDLGIRQALNLDGGGSTAMVVGSGADRTEVDAYTALPIVVWVEAA